MRPDYTEVDVFYGAQGLIDYGFINQGRLEDDNNISGTLEGHFNRFYKNTKWDLKYRESNRLRLYTKPVIGWKLTCESDINEGNHLSR